MVNKKIYTSEKVANKFNNFRFTVYLNANFELAPQLICLGAKVWDLKEYS